MAAILNKPQRAYIVKQITLGSTYDEIRESFSKKFGRTVNPRTIMRVKNQNITTITEAKAIIGAEGAISAINLKQKGYQLLESKLDHAIEDDGEIRKLRKQLQSGEITEFEYKSKIELYEALTISELAKVTDAMHSQAKGETNDPVTPQDTAALAALVAGINAGNPVQLIQVLGGQFGGNPPA